ncbi:YkvA family protein [Spongiibacter marinus]|uniref:YkvA family protein n=1 Tax=Spongiibacter marinus TaxID=354246 RepID=UPI001960B362|nr:YkvA family protein [Spongiibacter marinus]MBM7422679.1 uncharacterized membrane protein YkvA (DUF1232 family) [Spongiibacter marinus]
MKFFSERRARKILEDGADDAQQEQLEATLTNRRRILDKVLTNASLAPYLEQVKTLFQLVQDYARGNYREIPWWSIGAVITALGYILMPLDSIPDFIPVAGYLDDAVVLKLCLDMIARDLQQYRLSKDEAEQQGEISNEDTD